MPRQSRRTQLAQPVEINGVQKPLKRWITISWIRTGTVLSRLERGLTPLEALTKLDSEGNFLRITPMTGKGLWEPDSVLTVGQLSLTVREWVQMMGADPYWVEASVEGG